MSTSPGRPLIATAETDSRGRASLSAAAALRARTAPQHRATEAAYAGYDLTNRRSYTTFLQAHGRAVTAAEQVLSASAGLPEWQPRAPLLRQDLDALDAPMPNPLPFPAVRDTGEAWGVLYVLEGSRLGSELLSRRVPPGLPRSYLAASHGPGGWHAFRTRLEADLASDKLVLERAVTGAFACFTLFSNAALGAAEMCS